MANRKYKRLSEQDHQFIKDNFQKMTAAAIAKKIGCSAGYASRQCSILRYAEKMHVVKPAAASIHKAPPSTEYHMIEPAPEVVPGLLVKGVLPSDPSWELIKLNIEVKKRMYGTFKDPIYPEGTVKP